MMQVNSKNKKTPHAPCCEEIKPNGVTRAVLFCRNAMLIVSSVALLASCAKQIHYNATGLTGVRSVQVDADLRSGRSASTEAVPRGKNAGVGAAHGAVAGASLWATDPFLLAVAIIAPVTILATTAIGGVVGGAAGAATGISASEEQITAAIGVLKQNFEPGKHKNQFANEFAKHLEAQLSSSSGTCVSPRRNRTKCRRSGSTGQLLISAVMSVEASVRGGGAGGLDFVSRITVKSKPPKLLQPECLGWVHRARAGNLLELAKNGGKPLRSRLQQVVSEIARQLPGVMFGEGNSTNVTTPTSQKSGKKEINSKNWKKVACQ